MWSSRPIVSKPLQSQTDVPSYGPSRRSSASGESMRPGKTRSRDASKGSNTSSRGRKPYEVSEEVDRGLVKIVDGTDVSFDTLAQALEEVGGPRKLWLRKHFEQITGTKSFGFLRLKNHRPSSKDRNERQIRAQEMAQGWSAMQHDQSATQVQYAYVTRPISEMSGETRQPQRPSGRLSTISANSTVSNASTAAHGDRRSYTSSVATPLKRNLGEHQAGVPTDYVAKGKRTRALSISSITRQLEDLTGNTGLYEHIRRRSIPSHISPLLPKSWRWSKGSRVTSGRASYPERTNEQFSTGGNVYRRSKCVPDPDFAIHYHKPSLSLLNSQEESEMSAVLILLNAQIIGLPDEEACKRLNRQLPDTVDERKAYLNTPDAIGVTPLHLAVAYGFPQTCALLVQYGANVRAVSHRGSSVCRFARPAQDLTNGDMSLFHRIYNSRQWVCAGLPPRLPPEHGQQVASNADDRPITAVKRAKTNDTTSSLATVDETSVESSEVPIDPSRQSNVRESAYCGLSPIFTDFPFNRNNVEPSNHNSLDQQPLHFGLGESPIVVQDCIGDHQTYNSLLTPDSDPRSAWSIDSWSPVTSMKPQPFSRTSIPMNRASGLVNTHSPISHPPAAGGLMIMSGSTENRQDSISTSWHQAYPQASSFMPTTSQAGPPFISPSHQVDTGVQHSGQQPIFAEQFMYNNPSAFPQYAEPNQYQHDLHDQQIHQIPRAPHPQYMSNPTLPHYLTPPNDPVWSSDPLPGHEWIGQEIYDATARALAEQDFCIVPGHLQSSSEQTFGQHNDTNYYFDDNMMTRR